MEVKVLGPGCTNCVKLENEVKDVLDELNIAADVQKVTDMNQITEHGVMMTPALVVNGDVKVTGRMPRKDEIIKWIEEAE